MVDTTPALRVQTKLPNIIPPDNPTTPSPRVQPRRSPRQHQGPHIIPQCNMYIMKILAKWRNIGS
eukprot:14310000-Ditylum_brightwellii.AAC.1